MSAGCVISSGIPGSWGACLKWGVHSPPHTATGRGASSSTTWYCQPFEFQPLWWVCGNVVLWEIIDHPSSGVRGAWWRGFPERSFGAGRLAWRRHSCMARAGRGRTPEWPCTLPPGYPVLMRGWPAPGSGPAGSSARVAGCPGMGGTLGTVWVPH